MTSVIGPAIANLARILYLLSTQPYSVSLQLLSFSRSLFETVFISVTETTAHSFL